MFSLQVPIVDDKGRASRPFALFLQGIGGPGSTSLDGRISALETDYATISATLASVSATVASQATTIASHTASISAQSASITELQNNDLWVVPWL